MCVRLSAMRGRGWCSTATIVQYVYVRLPCGTVKYVGTLRSTLTLTLCSARTHARTALRLNNPAMHRGLASSQPSNYLALVLLHRPVCQNSLATARFQHRCWCLAASRHVRPHSMESKLGLGLEAVLGQF